MACIYSYVITHDTGFAPNPFGGFCTLATCKPKIRCAAKIGDWLVGTSSTRTLGKGKVIYAARIDEILSLSDYGDDSRFSVKRPGIEGNSRHGDCIYYQDIANAWYQRRNIHHTKDHMKNDLSGKNVLISNLYWYFGANAPDLPENLREIIKAGPGHKCTRSQEILNSLIAWLKSKPEGNSGVPSMPL
ncbi:Nucleotide modification associated domain 2 [compost metagenome]